MRILTRRIWRAFPELDEYDDMECRRFVQIARRRGPGTALEAPSGTDAVFNATASISQAKE